MKQINTVVTEVSPDFTERSVIHLFFGYHFDQTEINKQENQQGKCLN